MHRMELCCFHDASALEVCTFSYLLETVSVVSRTMVTAVLAIPKYRDNCTDDLYCFGKFLPSIFFIHKPRLCVIPFYIKIGLIHTNIKVRTFMDAMCCQKCVCVLFLTLWSLGFLPLIQVALPFVSSNSA